MVKSSYRLGAGEIHNNLNKTKQTEFVPVLPHIPHRPAVVCSGLVHESLELVQAAVDWLNILVTHQCGDVSRDYWYTGITLCDSEA